MAVTSMGEEGDPTSRYQILFVNHVLVKATRKRWDDDNHLFSKSYYGYTKKEAMKQHKDAYEKGK